MSNNILHIRSRRSFIASVRDDVSLRLKLTKGFEIAFLELINEHRASLIKASGLKNDEFDFAELGGISNQRLVT